MHTGALFSRRNSYRTPLIMAHRGGNTLAPQNSPAAFEAVARLGVWAIETDVRFTRDGVAVCHHDVTVDAMTDGEGEVSDFTFEELRRLKIDTGVGADTLPEEMLRIPTFGEYLDICMRYGCVPFIELKTDGGAEVSVRELRRRSMEDFAVISSSDFSRLEHTRRLSQSVFIHHIFSSEEYIGRLYDLGYAGMAFNIKNLDEVPPSLVGDVHEAGVRVCLRAADTPEKLRRMIDLGLDYQPSNKVFGL